MASTSGHGGGLRFDDDGNNNFSPIILFWLPEGQATSEVEFQILDKTGNEPKIKTSIYTVAHTQGVNKPDRPKLDNDKSDVDLQAVSEEATIVTAANKRSLIGLPLTSTQELHGRCTISVPPKTGEPIDFAIFPTKGGVETFELGSNIPNLPGGAAVTIETEGLEPGLVAIALYNMPPSESGEKPNEKEFGAGAGGKMIPARKCYVYIAFARPAVRKNNPNLAPTVDGVDEDLSWSTQLRNMKIDFKRVLQIMTNDNVSPAQVAEDKLYRMSIRHKSGTTEFMDLDDFDFVRIGNQDSEAIFDLGPQNDPNFDLGPEDDPDGSNDYPSGMYILGNPVVTQVAAEAMQQSSVDINNAGADELCSLSGIGDVHAQSIIEHRPYEEAEEIMNVPGIGPKTYEKLTNSITV